MAKKEKLTKKIKEGVSVEELEKFARKYINEVFLILSLIIATITSIAKFFTGAPWGSLFFVALGAIIAIALPAQIGKLLKKIFKMISQAEKTVSIIIGIVRIVLSIFIPFILFAELGLIAGYSFHLIGREFYKEEEPKSEYEKPEEKEEL